ncbi:MAG: FeoB-associated Cys-rich membrane protein [Gemmatimonadaceae bacterium]|nr:FeoB-associated Cys-rich membrane protein [Gemmatimonadaceae bacterium]
MPFDTLLVFGIVAAAAAFTAWRAWKALRPARKTGCGSDCGCGH